MFPSTFGLVSILILVCFNVAQSSIATFIPQDSVHNRVARSTGELRTQRIDPNCDPKWTKIYPNHTMCLVDIGEEVVLDQAAKDAILQQHNDHRREVDPPAADMTKLVWDDDLAEVAAKWARQCSVHHDSSAARHVPSLPEVLVGQNIAAGYLSYADGIQAWFDEYKDFLFGVGSFNGGVVTHYTQMVAARTHRVGCARAVCRGDRYQRYYVCNYAAFQLEQDVKTPYLNSTSCSACPAKCDASGKLCDCGGKLCLNRGRLDLATCSCTCRRGFQGERCEMKVCLPDNPNCGKAYPRSLCNNVTFRTVMCPNMCGACPPQVS